MAGHSKLPDYEPIEHNGRRARNAIHRAETFALWAEEASDYHADYHADNDGATALAAIAQAWAAIAVATEKSFGGGAA